MEKYKKILSLWPIVLSVCVGVYLTYLMDVITLNSFLQRAFVFCYFVFLVTVLFFVFKKHVGFDCNPKYIAAAAVLSISALLLFPGSLVPVRNERNITFRAVVEENSSHPNEVWLAEAALDGVSVPLSELEVISNNGWVYASELDDYVYYPKIGENENEITFRVYGDSMSVVFARNSWSGNVEYFTSSSDGNTLELFTQEVSPTPLKLELDLKGDAFIIDIVFCTLGALVTLMFFVYQLIVLLDRTLKIKKKQNYLARNFLDNTLVFGSFFLALLVLLEIFERVYDYALLDITAVIGCFVLILIYPYSSRIIPMLRKLKVLEIVLLIAVTFAVTFQTVAEFMFMDLDKITLGFIDVFAFILAMAVVAVPILEITLFIDNRTKTICRRR